MICVDHDFFIFGPMASSFINTVVLSEKIVQVDSLVVKLAITTLNAANPLKIRVVTAILGLPWSSTRVDRQRRPYRRCHYT